MRLPIIELDSADQDVLAARIWDMLTEEGFFYLVGDRVSLLPSAELENAARAFFAQPLSEKLRTYIGKSSIHRGYVPTGEEGEAHSDPDLKEGFDSGLENIGVTFGGAVPTQSESGWPELSGFRTSVLNYQEAILALAREVASLLSASMGMPLEYLNQRAGNPPNQLRLLHYPGSRKKTQGVGSHTDFECFTLLMSAKPGLEVRRSDGDWTTVSQVPDSLVVTTGDLLEILTNGALRASEHRVGWLTEDRLSFPYFFSLDATETVSPLSQFVHDQGHHYPDTNVGEHLVNRTSEVFRYLRAPDDEA